MPCITLFREQANALPPCEALAPRRFLGSIGHDGGDHEGGFLNLGFKMSTEPVHSGVMKLL